MNKYYHLSKEELLRIIEKQEIELKNKKYGLVWDSEREPEKVVLDCKNHLPVLKRVKSKEIKTDDSDDNILIEGDNYHALTVLNYTHKGKIDVIYIDPPYNTGKANEWKYNDRYVDKNDGYRHSKWLNFMEKRLRLAKELLKDDGVIFISIDDHELYQLKLLMDKIFGEENFVANFIRQTGATRAMAKYFDIRHDYILIYSKRKELLSFNELPNNTKNFINLDNDPDGAWSTQDFTVRNGGFKYEIPSIDGSKRFKRKWAKDITSVKKMMGDISANMSFIDIYKKYAKKVLYNNKEWYIVGKFVFKGKDKIINLKKYANKVATIRNHTLYNNIGSNKSASALLKQILNVNITESIFETPKPLELLKYIIFISTKKDSIILDFFAGSGTTGHAVLELNKEDGGNRKFILVTNNEGNIATEVCYPRLQNVIKGYRKNGNGEWIEGLGGNLQYFKTSLIKKSKNRDQVKVDLTQKSTEMLCVKENIYNLEKEGEDYKIFSSNKKDRFLCIYYNFIDDSFNEFLKELKKLKSKKIIYMFSIDNKVDKSLFSELEDFTIEPIPQKILDIYSQLVKMNIPVRTETIFIDLEKAKKQIFENEDKDTGAKILRVVLEKLLQKIAQLNQISILNDKGKEIKISNLNDILKAQNVLSQVEWQENQTYLAIGNHASHGEYDEYTLEQVKSFYRHVKFLIEKFNI